MSSSQRQLICNLVLYCVAAFTTANPHAIAQHNPPLPTQTLVQVTTQAQRDRLLEFVAQMMQDIAALDLKTTSPIAFIERYGTFASQPYTDSTELVSNKRLITYPDERAQLSRDLALESDSWPIGQDTCAQPGQKSACGEAWDRREWHFNPRIENLREHLEIVAEYDREHRQMHLEMTFRVVGEPSDVILTIQDMKWWFGDVFIHDGKVSIPHGMPTTTFDTWRARSYEFQNLKNHRFDLAFETTRLHQEPDNGNETRVGAIVVRYAFKR